MKIFQNAIFHTEAKAKRLFYWLLASWICMPLLSIPLLQMLAGLVKWGGLDKNDLVYGALNILWWISHSILFFGWIPLILTRLNWLQVCRARTSKNIISTVLFILVITPVILVLMFIQFSYGEQNTDGTTPVYPKVQTLLTENEYHHTDVRQSLDRQGKAFAYEKTDYSNKNITQVIAVMNPTTNQELAIFEYKPEAEEIRVERLVWDDQNTFWVSVHDSRLASSEHSGVRDDCVKAYSYHEPQVTFVQRSCVEVPTNVWDIREGKAYLPVDALPLGAEVPEWLKRTNMEAWEKPVNKLSPDKSINALNYSGRYNSGPGGFFGKSDIRLLNASGKMIGVLGDLTAIGWTADGSLIAQASPNRHYSDGYSVVRITRTELDHQIETYRHSHK